jgi:polar amino acid transport system substrate-binding protein
LNKALVIVSLLSLLFYAAPGWAREPLLIVTDPWPPYSYEENGIATGLDVEITRAVFKQINVAVEIKFYPWKRSVLMVKNRTADGILSASITPQRKEFMYFPEESVSEGVTVFFINKGRHIKFEGLEDLNGLKAGAQLGYKYCDEIDQSPFAIEATRTKSLTQNINMLLAKRIDFLIEVDAVGFSTAKELGVLDQIDIIPNAQYCQGGNYLAFSKKPTNEQLASQFSNGLHAFKQTADYQHILRKYGLSANMDGD